LASEVSWGHRFDKLVTFEKDDGTYKIDYSRFNSIIPVDTPACSARELEELKENVRRLSESFSISDDKTISERYADSLNE
jgi:potassium inwardly-rectifying channel subfamily J